MEEKVLKGKKIGMLMLLLTTLGVLLAIGVFVCGIILVESTENPALLIVGIVLLFLSWIPYCGLKVINPQEALVLTLFGKYVGTLKGNGFYWVNPFCSSVNPAAKTKLNQSGDVSTHVSLGSKNGEAVSVELTVTSKPSSTSSSSSMMYMENRV